MSKKTIETNKSKDILLWVAVVMLTMAALAANYYYSTYSLPIRIIGWIFWLIISLGLAALTSSGKVALEYLQESKNELHKVVWPTRQETVQTTLMVMVMVAITGTILWGVDTGITWFIGKITHING